MNIDNRTPCYINYYFWGVAYKHPTPCSMSESLLIKFVLCFCCCLIFFFFSVVVCSIVFCSGPSVPPYLPVSLSRCLPESLFLSGENSSLISYSFFIFYFFFFLQALRNLLTKNIEKKNINTQFLAKEANKPIDH